MSALTVDDFNADTLVNFVKEFLLDDPDANPNVFIAVAIGVPVPEKIDDFKLSLGDMGQFFVSNIISSNEMAEQFRLYSQENQQPRLLMDTTTTNPYTDLKAEPEQAEMSGKATLNSVTDSSEESYNKWLDSALSSGAFNQISEKWGLWEKLITGQTIATWLRDWRKLGVQDAAVDAIRFEIAGTPYEALVEPNPDQTSSVKKLWTRRGERLRTQLANALNGYYLAMDGKQKIREEEIMKQKMKDWDEKQQTPLEARLHQIKQKAMAGKAKAAAGAGGKSYFNPKTNHVHTYIQKQKAISGRMNQGKQYIDQYSTTAGESKAVSEAGRALKLI